jgi:hypothetical protein
MPTFTIQVIRPGEGPDGATRYGYIPRDQVDRFKRDYRDARVLI